MAVDAAKARSIFIEAVENHSPEEWARFLDAACGPDDELRRRTEALLQAHGGKDALLDQGLIAPGMVRATCTLPAIAERPGTVIGPYKLLEQIGEGGFGIVFMAEQLTPVRRKVALKVIKPGMDSNQIIARFEAERQALAMMDHPNIAKVHDAGATDSGRPYFVMELVKGLPLTEYCDGNQLTPRQRLELFIPVCQAVQHAHQKGIIHRDIKPSNVLITLVDGAPVPKIIDFGIAKATGQQLTDKTLFTNFAQMIGTPLYMSPEQAAISGVDVDTRSDIYSLGVLLYEMLTGTTPFDKDRLKQAAFDEVRRIIREEEPPKPSTRISTLGHASTTISAQRQSDPRRLRQLCRGDLDWIVMKALEKDRNRRYESAAALAADVQRHMSDEEVGARPPSAGYRLRKFLRRNKRTVVIWALLGIVLLTAVVSLAVSNLLIWRERQEALRQRDEAERQRRLAYQAIDELYAQIVDKKSGEMMAVEVAGTNPYMPEAVKTRNKALQKDFLQKALPVYEQVAQRQGTDPTERQDAAKAWRRVGEIHENLGQPEKAEPAYGEAIALFEKLIVSFPDLPEYQLELAGSYINLGNLLNVTGRLQEAEKAYHQALVLMKNLRANLRGRAEDKQSAVMNFRMLVLTEEILTARSQEQARILREQDLQAMLETKNKKFDLELYTKANKPTFTEEQTKVDKKTLKRIQNSFSEAKVVSGKALNELLVQISMLQRQGRQTPTVPLDENLLKRINVTTSQGSIALLKDGGRLKWPSALNGPPFAAERERLSALALEAFEQASVKHRLEASHIVQIRNDVGELGDRLKKAVNDIPTTQYLEAKRFLMNFEDALKALEQPDVGRYFNGEYVAKGKTVAELVDYLVNRGLLFAPALPEDEPAYRALYERLAEYFVALAAPAKP